MATGGGNAQGSRAEVEANQVEQTSEMALVRGILLRASGVGAAGIVEWLLRRYRHLDLLRSSGAGTKGISALHVACKNGHLAVVKSLVAGGARLTASTKDGVLPLHLAAQCTRGAEALALLNYLRGLTPAVDVNACDGNQQTVLHHAARAGAGAKVLVLLLSWLEAAAASACKGRGKGRAGKGKNSGGGAAGAGAAVAMGARDAWGRTPLHWWRIAKSHRKSKRALAPRNQCVMAHAHKPDADLVCLLPWCVVGLPSTDTPLKCSGSSTRALTYPCAMRLAKRPSIWRCVR